MSLRCVTAPPKPVETPAKPTVTGGGTAFTVKWDPISVKEAKYTVEKCERQVGSEKWGTWKVHSRVPQVGTSATLAGLMPNREHKCRVFAVCAPEKSDPSEESEIFVTKGPKYSLEISKKSLDEIKLLILQEACQENLDLVKDLARKMHSRVK